VASKRKQTTTRIDPRTRKGVEIISQHTVGLPPFCHLCGTHHSHSGECPDQAARLANALNLIDQEAAQR
jgi:hypothetical protein